MIEGLGATATQEELRVPGVVGLYNRPDRLWVGKETGLGESMGVILDIKGLEDNCNTGVNGGWVGGVGRSLFDAAGNVVGVVISGGGVDIVTCGEVV